MLERFLRQIVPRGEAPTSAAPAPPWTREAQPWRHPFLTRENLAAFRAYSERVWDFARVQRQSRDGGPPRFAFAINMAQSMYQWTRIVREAGFEAELYLHPDDRFLVSQPEWEDFDGEAAELWQDGRQFLLETLGIAREPWVHALPKDESYQQVCAEFESWKEPRRLLGLLNELPSLAADRMIHWRAYNPYWRTFAAIGRADVGVCASLPFFCYLSGTPYLMLPVGGDLMYDSGRGDDLGQIMMLSLHAARFTLAGGVNYPGHLRRLGLVNGVYFAFMVDTSRYAPGRSPQRQAWVEQWGEGFYVFSPSRIDFGVKGQSLLVEQITELVRVEPDLRFVFPAWGNDCERFQAGVTERGLQGHVRFVPLAGKRRLIDYYRAADCVLDQLVFGSHGATCLEAMACGAPVLINLNQPLYHALYGGDRPPVAQVDRKEDLPEVLLRLKRDPVWRRSLGEAARAWIVRNHGHETQRERLLDLACLAADGVSLPSKWENPLAAPLTPEEEAYHRLCADEAKAHHANATT